MTMMRFRFTPVDGGRFVVYREHVEHFVSSDGIGEHIWVTIRAGTTDKKGKANLERRMGK